MNKLNKEKDTLLIDGVITTKNDQVVINDVPLIHHLISYGLLNKKVNISIEIEEKKRFPIDPHYQKELDKFKIKYGYKGYSKYLILDEECLPFLFDKKTAPEFYQTIRFYRKEGFVQAYLWLPRDYNLTKIPSAFIDMVTIIFFNQDTQRRVSTDFSEPYFVAKLRDDIIAGRAK